MKLSCAPAANASCFTCRGSSRPVCTGRACALGGADSCAAKGETCVLTKESPCYRCDAGTSALVAAVTVGCGNGQIDPGETCDDGSRNGTTSDNCLADCTLKQGILPRCGDGIVERGESCDDGASNGTPGDSCTADCRFLKKHACGDGIMDPGEICDDGVHNGTPADGCLANCTLKPGILPRCGDGILESGEQCDDGARNGSKESLCDQTCRYRAVTDIAGALWGWNSRGQASIVGSVPIHAAAGKTGPAAIAIGATGAALGYAWMRRRRKKNASKS
jgi:cysteine-rich repeat protein